MTGGANQSSFSNFFTDAMFAALVVLLGLLSLSPAMVLVDGPILQGVIPLVIALDLILVAGKLPPGEAQHLQKVLRNFVIGAAVPVLWLVIQMLPVPSFLGHPIWPSVEAALQHGVRSSISIDIGATAMSLVRYLSIVGFMILTCAVTISRERAELVLIAATAASVLIAFLVFCHDLFGFSFIVAGAGALDCACLGLILSLACASLVYERHETRRNKPGQSETKFIANMAVYALAFLICLGAIIGAKSGSLAFAAACGCAVFCGVILIRRLELGRWGAAAMVATAGVIAVILVTSAAGNSDLRLAFVKKGAASLDFTQRILADAPFLGSGAGTFDALLPIYQTLGATRSDLEAATAAAQFSIEMGRPTLWLAIMVAGIGAFVFLRGAAERGRDSFYAAAGAACLMTLTILSFVNVGMFGSAPLSIVSVILGLALAQVRSRSAA